MVIKIRSQEIQFVFRGCGKCGCLGHVFSKDEWEPVKLTAFSKCIMLCFNSIISNH